MASAVVERTRSCDDGTMTEFGCVCVAGDALPAPMHFACGLGRQQLEDLFHLVAKIERGVFRG